MKKPITIRKLKTQTSANNHNKLSAHDIRASVKKTEQALSKKKSADSPIEFIEMV